MFEFILIFFFAAFAAARRVDLAIGSTHAAAGAHATAERRSVPAVVGYVRDTDGGGVATVVGVEAVDAVSVLATVSPQDVVAGVMRVVGRAPDDDHVRSLQIGGSAFSCELRADADNPNQLLFDLFLNNDRRRVRPEAVLAELIRHLAPPGSRATVAIPLRFDENQRAAVREAFALANVELIAIDDAEVAIAAALLAERAFVAPESVLVVRWGGAALDVALLRRSGAHQFSVVDHRSDESLGGAELDRLVVQAVTHIDAPSLSLLAVAERAKRQLATDDAASIELGDDFLPLSLAQFDELSAGVLDRVLALAVRVAVKADVVVLAGGSTRIRRLQALVREHYGAERVVFADHDSTTAAVIGLGILHPAAAHDEL